MSVAKRYPKTSRTAISVDTRIKLWAVSAGRCELCNRVLYKDLTMGYDANFGEIAHINAVSKGGPRHKKEMPPEEKNHIDNLMLLCEEHHHLIDSHPEYFNEELLLQRKKKHEERIRKVTEIPSEQSCQIVTYFSNINQHQEFSSDRLFREAVLLSGRAPMQGPTIDLSTDSYTSSISNKEIFQKKAQDLQYKFTQYFDTIIKSKDSIGVFALAPQSLLFKLGTLVNDQYNAITFQCHRTGHKWAWPKTSKTVNYLFSPTKTVTNSNKVALVIDLSATVMDDRIISVLGNEVSIFHIKLATPCRTFVTSEKVQEDFVKTFREAMECIKNYRPTPSAIHIFPVMPNSLAIKAGMDYMPKTDLPVILYEQSNQLEGFFEALTINN